jgi:hypothetical protein
MSTAMGCQRAPPAIAIGAKPRTVVADVNNIGRRRWRDAAAIASRKSEWDRSISIWSVSTIALLIMMPARLMTPSLDDLNRSTRFDLSSRLRSPA